MNQLDLSVRARKIVRENGFNRTKTQVALMKILIQAESPVSREDIENILEKTCPDKVTIYRILERFCKKGLVHKAYLNGRALKYELAHNCTEKQCHPHFICNNCGKTFCLTGLSFPLVKGLKKGFVVHRQQVRMNGLCSSCT